MASLNQKSLALLTCIVQFCALSLVWSPADASVKTSVFRDGDIIFQTMISGQSEAIQLATHSKYSHMGILFQKAGRWFVYEAVGPVKETPFQSWIEAGKGSHYAVKRLRKPNNLSSDDIEKLRIAGLK